jgi:hypothetical protein
MLFIVPARAQASRTRRYAVPAASLTPSARSGGLSAGDGTKNGLPAPNKERDVRAWRINQKVLGRFV